jgi:ABC-type sugar transport system ATPase subunit
MSDPGVNRFVDHGVCCVVRPEHLRLQPFEGKQRQFTFVVLSVETNGSETYLHGTMADDHWVARVPGLHRIEAGQQVTLHAPQDAVLRFSSAHG